MSSNTLRFNGRTRQGLLNHLFSPLLRDVFAMRTAPLFTKQRFSLPALSQVLVPVAAFMGYSIAKIRAAVKPLPSEAFPRAFASASSVILSPEIMRASSCTRPSPLSASISV